MRFIFLLFFFSLNAVDYEALFQEQSKSFKYLYEPNQPLFVFFSSTPGMGKSTLSRLLEEELKGIRISADETREFLAEQKAPKNALEPYLLYLLNRLHEASPNRLILWDRSIDRTYEPMLSLIALYPSPHFLIRLEAPYETVVERILKRALHPETTLKILDDCWQDYEAFGEKYTPDFLFDNSQEILNATPLLEAINSREESRTF